MESLYLRVSILKRKLGGRWNIFEEDFGVIFKGLCLISYNLGYLGCIKIGRRDFFEVIG